jgi:hypothetical protein
MPYDLIPNMPEHRLAPLMQTFNKAVANKRLRVGLGYGEMRG